MFLQDKNIDSFLKETSEQIEDRIDEANFEKAYGMSAGMIKNIRLYMEESHARNK